MYLLEKLRQLEERIERIEVLLLNETSIGRAKDNSDLEGIVTEYLREFGIPANLRGYNYIRDGIIMAIENMDVMNSVTKILYPDIAKKYATAPSRVERAIRHAVEVAWERGNMDKIQEIFSYTVKSGKGKPTNSEFIALLADTIRQQQKK